MSQAQAPAVLHDGDLRPDINVVCSGFPYGLALAVSLEALNPGAHALVIGAEVYSRILNFDDRKTAVLLGDGAGAAVVGPVPTGYGVAACGLHTQGDAHELISVRAGGSRVPTSHETVDSGGHYFTMQGREVSSFVLDEVPPAIADLLHDADVRTEEIDHFVPHQPNGNLLDNLVSKTDLDHARTQVQVDPDLVVMGMLADRRDELGRARTNTVNRLHRVLLELFPGEPSNSYPLPRPAG